MIGPFQYCCGECYAWGPLGAIPHKERCSRYLPPAPAKPKCDCGSPDVHWQFCKAFVPYEDT